MTEATPATETSKAPKRGIGTVIKEAIAAGKTNEEALAACQSEFPASKATLASVSWYRNDLRKSGKSVPTAREVKKDAPKDPLA
jgi:hypothetical protein